MPKLSVIMGAYNCALTLEETLASISKQTMTDWELIVCDDSSTDETWTILSRWSKADLRIKPFRNHTNIGLAQTLDKCIDKASCELLVRHDADDRSIPMRFQRLYDACAANPEAAVIGSWAMCFNQTGNIGIIKTLPRPEKFDLIKGTIFIHPSCILRKRSVKAVGGYGSQPWLRRSQDYYLWFKMYAAGMYGINIQEPLYEFREDEAAQRRRGFRARLMESRVRWNGFKIIEAPVHLRLLAFIPLLKCLVPASIYRLIKQRRLKT